MLSGLIRGLGMPCRNGQHSLQYRSRPGRSVESLSYWVRNCLKRSSSSAMASARLSVAETMSSVAPSVSDTWSRAVPSVAVSSSTRAAWSPVARETSLMPLAVPSIAVAIFSQALSMSSIWSLAVAIRSWDCSGAATVESVRDCSLSVSSVIRSVC